MPTSTEIKRFWFLMRRTKRNKSPVVEVEDPQPKVTNQLSVTTSFVK